MNKKFLILVGLIIIIVVGVRFGKNSFLHLSPNTEPFRDTNRLILTKHVKCRMDCRHITTEEIKEIIHSGNVNYTKSRRGNNGDETYALEGYSDEHQHLRVVVAPENDGLVVITCIDLDKEWPCNCY